MRRCTHAMQPRRRRDQTKHQTNIGYRQPHCCRRSLTLQFLHGDKEFQTRRNILLLMMQRAIG